jgi:AraC-like DNA-binding protein
VGQCTIAGTQVNKLLPAQPEEYGDEGSPGLRGRPAAYGYAGEVWNAYASSVTIFAAGPRSRALAAFVKTFHYHETDRPFALERIVPSGEPHLLINLGEDEFRTYSGPRAEHQYRQRGAVIAGPHTQSVILDTGEQRCLAAVMFHPGGAAHFFSPPLSSVSNTVVHLAEMWGPDGRSLRERLLDAPTPAAKFRVFEDVLGAHFAPKVDPAMQYAIAALKAGTPVSRVAEQLGLLPRTFARRFSAIVGVNPKRFARVQRMQRILRVARRSRRLDWCALAAAHGYTDQAHLIHEFRDLADMTPSEYMRHSPRRNNHVTFVQYEPAGAR